MRIALYGRPANAALVVAASLAAAAGASARWRDPKYYKSTEMEKGVTIVVLDPKTPNAEQIVADYTARDITVLTADSPKLEDELRALLGVKPAGAPADEPKPIAEVAYARLKELAKAHSVTFASNVKRVDLAASLEAAGITHDPMPAPAE